MHQVTLVSGATLGSASICAQSEADFVTFLEVATDAATSRSNSNNSIH